MDNDLLKSIGVGATALLTMMIDQFSTHPMASIVSVIGLLVVYERWRHLRISKKNAELDTQIKQEQLKQLQNEGDSRLIKKRKEGTKD
jgi:Co/Zn/Cd efflux system component